MKIVRNRAEARDLPSRHHFAIFRLAAFLRLRRPRPAGGRSPRSHEDIQDVILAVEENQSTAEVLTVGTWFFATSACYLATLLDGWPLVLALPVAFAAAVILFQIVFISFGLTIAPLLRKLAGSASQNNAAINSTFCLLVLGAASGWFLRDASWLRVVAWVYFLCIAMNASAALALRLLRERVEALEASCGGVASGA